MIKEELLEELQGWNDIKSNYDKWITLMNQQVSFSLESSDIHTKAHCTRVMLYALLIAHRMGLGVDAENVLGAAAAFHDSRRQDDWLDVGHGQRAADYYKEFCTENSLKFDERTYYIMAYHDRDDKIGKEKITDKRLDNGELLYEIFKDADALDRFRIASNALDIRMLRTETAKKIVPFAKHLVEETQNIQKADSPDHYLIVVDMQNDFVSGSLGTDEAKQIVQPVVKKIERYRGNVLFTIDSHKENYLATQEGKKLPVKHCISGTWGWQPVDEIYAMQQKRNGAIYMKPVFGSTKLVDDLVALNEQQPIKEIELIGVCTDICVVSNAIMIKNALPEVPIYVDSSCCAGTTSKKHQEALSIMESCQIGIR